MIELVLFLTSILLCFFFPGKLLNILLKIKLTFLQEIFFATTIGIMIFTLVSYIFSWMRAEILILPFFLMLNLFLFLKYKHCIPFDLKALEVNKILFIVICAGIFSITMIGSGQFGETVRLVGTGGSDGLWHLALINELKANFPPEVPGFTGVFLKGYHFFFDFLLAKISNIFYISPITLYFRFFPPLVAFLWALGVYILMHAWSKSSAVGLWAVFLTMFGGSFSFILPLQGHRGLSLDSAFGILQPATALVNPPFAISIVIIIAVLFALHNYLLTRKKSWLVYIILCTGLVSLFKIYAGMILLGGFAFLALFEILKRRIALTISLLCIGILFLGTYWIFTDQNATLIFAPLWAPHKVLEDNLTWYGYTEKQYTYSKLSVIRGLVEIEVYGLFVFIVGNIGTRAIGIIPLLLLLFKKQKPSLFAMTVLAMLFISILTPLLFIQSGKVFEIIQMAWYFLFFLSLFASLGFAALFGLRFNKAIKAIVFFVVVTATLPSVYESYNFYIKPIIISLSNPISLSKSYYEAMRFLNKHGEYNLIVLETPSKDINPIEADLVKWYKMDRSPTLSALANKKSYLHYANIDFSRVDITPRIHFLQKIMLFTKNPGIISQKEVEGDLRKNNISYIYSPSPLPALETLKIIHKIFQNEAATIYYTR